MVDNQVVGGAPGQAPIKAENLRQALFTAKARGDVLQERLDQSERHRADMANKMSAHKDTRERAAALDDLVFNRGEGVVVHFRRPDESQVYPAVVSKAALAALEPNRWEHEILSPLAALVLSEGERAEAQWVTNDPTRDAKVREDHDAVRKALGAATHTVAPAVEALMEELAERGTQLHSSQVSAGKWQASAEKHERRIAELVTEMETLRKAVVPDASVDIEAVALAGMGLAPDAELSPQEAEDAQVAANVAEAVRPAAAAKALLLKEEEEYKKERKERTRVRRAERAKAAKAALKAAAKGGSDG